DRWLDVSWSEEDETDHVHVGRISVTLGNEPGSLGSLTTVIGKSGGNITNLKITNRSVDFFELLVDIEVQNLRHLSNIIAALRATPVINSVERARG
ncbi:MAG TPA: ACT domain-containing protein, partial [Stellaceae bacterium]|nr:ACT domain-containing protein [Stellaceae bacterium]